MSTKPIKIAVILAGCGHKDGAEIHEATLSLLAIHRLGAEYQCFAPDREQHHVLNFITDEEINEQRNILVESARIARGNIQNLNAFDAQEYDALIMPGGFGVAKNLCDFAIKGEITWIDSDLERAITSTHKAGKPIGALCISPIILAKLIPGANLTLGAASGAAESAEAMGAVHTATGHGEIVIDESNKLVTTPCYMLDARVDQIADGAENLVKAVIDMIG